MAQRIRITAGGLSVYARLSDTPTAEKIRRVLPLETTFQTWGEEIYFSIPVEADLDETAREVVEAGTLGYWPAGPAFCIFFGPTPASRGDEIRAASAVNIVGALEGDPDAAKALMEGSRIRIEAVEEETP